MWWLDVNISLEIILTYLAKKNKTPKNKELNKSIDNRRKKLWKQKWEDIEKLFFKMWMDKKC